MTLSNFKCLNKVLLIPSLNKTFHNTSIIYSNISQEELEVRLANLRSEDTVNNTDNMENVLDRLTPRERDAFSDFTLINEERNQIIINNENINNNENSSDNSVDIININEESNSDVHISLMMDDFKTSFPNFNEKNMGLISSILEKVYGCKLSDLMELVEKKGVLDGVYHILKKSPIFSIFSLGDTFNQHSEQLKINSTEIQKLQQDLHDLKLQISNIESLDQKINSTFEKANHLMDLAIKSKNLVHISVSGMTMVSVLLAHRMALKSYIGALDPIIHREPFNPVKYNELLRRRANHAKYFNFIIFPMCCIVGLLKANYSSKINFNFTLNSDNFEVSSSGNTTDKKSISLSFLGLLGLKKWKYYIFIPGLVILIQYVGLPYFKSHYPILYESLTHFISTYVHFLPILIMLWYLILTIFYMVQLKLFLNYYINNTLHLNTKYPKFINDWLSSLHKDSQSESKKEFMRSYIHYVYLLIWVDFITFILIFIYYITKII